MIDPKAPAAPVEVVTPIKPSEALRLGRLIRPEKCTGSWTRGDNAACALGAMEAIREEGLLIPTDIAVASIDNTLESASARPPLTTVHIPKYEIGILALRKLHQMIEGEDLRALSTANSLCARLVDHSYSYRFGMEIAS